MMAVRFDNSVITFIAAIILACSILPYSSASSLRGVDPSLAVHYYGSDGKFICLDGSKTLPSSQINDGFCDCLDGTDEPGESYDHGYHADEYAILSAIFANLGCPYLLNNFTGTSACPNGKFFCMNLGAEPVRLNASFVDDGVCGELECGGVHCLCCVKHC